MHKRVTQRLVSSRVSVDLFLHHIALFFGGTKCSGHPCQKHPSIYTATFARLNTMSGLLRTVWICSDIQPVSESGGMKNTTNGQLPASVSLTF